MPLTFSVEYRIERLQSNNDNSTDNLSTGTWVEMTHCPTLSH